VHEKTVDEFFKQRYNHKHQISYKVIVGDFPVKITINPAGKLWFHLNNEGNIGRYINDWYQEEK
jgi:hypothetical protein